MKHNIYAIFDNASGLYSRPIFATSDGEAKRTFADLALDAEHPVGKHPQDYTMFRTGIYDDVTANFTNEDNSSLGNALEMIAQSQTVNRENLDLFDKEILDGEKHAKAISDNFDPRNNNGNPST